MIVLPIHERQAAEIKRLRDAEQEAFQKYVDANEALIEAKEALEAIRNAKMPGEARAIAIRALERLALTSPERK